ncbi:MAG TPA: phosphomannomutase/phosphoglucomutase [Lysobacter sp.]|nr:phosphomannomutase/phosphoglucomutase [Lysobacter sp.]
MDIKMKAPGGEHLRKLALPLAVVLGLLALWLAWSGVQQWRDHQRETELTRVRDSVAQSIGSVAKARTTQLGKLLDAAPVRAALSPAPVAEPAPVATTDAMAMTPPAVPTSVPAPDFAAVAAALKAAWPQAEAVEVWPADMGAQFAALPKGGYGQLAAAEAALVAKAPVARLGQAGGQKLLVAAPVPTGDAPIAVALVRLPPAAVIDPLRKAEVPGGGYLALRQGTATLLENGDASLANGAEAMATKIPDTDLRVAAGLPDAAAGAFGLGAIPCLIGALVLAGLAFFAWIRLGRGSRAVAVAKDEGAGPEPTLAQALADAPAPEPAPTAPKVVVPAEPARVAVAIDRGIFRAYDIRGVVGQTLDAGVAELIGQAIGSQMQEQGLEDIVVGRDGRLSGPDLVAGLVAGLRKAGRNVIDIGLAPTPLVYFGSFHLRTGCCVAVTGSHNPPDYNGFKIVIGGETLSGKAITGLHDRIAEDRLFVAPTPGTLSERDIGQDYVDRISSDVQADRRLKVVVDAGNGVAGGLGPRVLEAIGVDVEELYCEIDGTFPNHHPDPSEPHNLQDLIRMVQRLGADVGLAFDGDGDRLGVVTRSGENIYPDRLLMLFAGDVLERNPGAVIVYDVKCSGRLPGYILRHGGSPLMWKTGHSLIKAKMRETGAELAGEMSGHFFFGERWYGFDDGIYAAARLIEILSARSEPVEDVLGALPNGVSTPEIKVDAPNGDPHAFVERFRAAAQFENARSSTIDGLRVDFADGWGLVRASNTTPVLVMRFDADSEDALKRIQGEFRAQLLALDPELKLPF